MTSVPVTLAPVVMVWPPVSPLLVGVGGAPELLPVHPGAGVVDAALVAEGEHAPLGAPVSRALAGGAGGRGCRG